MSRSSRLSSQLIRQPSMSIDEFRSPRQTSPYSPEEQRRSHRSQQSNEMKSYRGLESLVMRSTSRSPDQNSTNRSLRKLIVDEPINPRSSRLSRDISLKSIVIEGKWHYHESSDDQLRLQALGIEHLVHICFDIMTQTRQSVEEKPLKRKRSSPSSNSSSRSRGSMWPVVKIDRFRRISDKEKRSFQREKIFNLMTIVFEAASTSESISELVRIWREVVEHGSRPRPLPIFDDKNQPRISYPLAIGRLVRDPHDQIFQIGLHAALIGTHSTKDLRRLAKKLDVDQEQFDIRTIRESSEKFKELIHFLRAQRLNQRRKQFQVQTDRIPFEPKKKRSLHANVLNKRFPIVRQAIEYAGFTIRPENDLNCDLIWIDTIIPPEILSKLKPYQKINQFLGMNQITDKHFFIKNYQKLSSLYPQWFNYLPKTWILPEQQHLWYSYASKQPKKSRSTFVLKSFQSGIHIECDYKQIGPMDNCFIQEYISEPLLFDEFKSDLRVFVLITSCDPLRIYLYNDGFVRLSPQKYENPLTENQSNLRIHSTHHFINYETMRDDLDVNFHQKRTLSSLFARLHRENHDIKILWQTIQDIVIKTVFIVEPHLLSSYKKHRPGSTLTSESVTFELLSFEFLLDRNARPWLIEVERCQDFDIPEQIDFDLKMKLLFETIELLHFRMSNREKSNEIENLEKQNRLFATLGKTIESDLSKLKDDYLLIKTENERDRFESEHNKNFLRLFPVRDEDRMKELIEILSLSMENFDPTIKENSSWLRKYSLGLNEVDLFDRISRLESRPRPISSSIDDSIVKPVATQTPSDILRLTSSKSKKSKKPKIKSSGEVSRPTVESVDIRPGVSANRIVQKEFYQERQTDEKQRRRSSSPRSPKSNNKSQMVTSTSILRATRRPSSTSILPTKSTINEKFHLNENDFDRLDQLVFDEMKKLKIRHPKRTESETDEICNEIINHWDFYQPFIARFWFAELDRDKRQSVVEIVWKHFEEILRKICLVDEVISTLPLNRHILTLKRRLLSNNGHILWETCLNRHQSWESVFLRSSNRLNEIEMNCCYRFVELCQDSLFIIYRYSIEEKKQ